MYEFRKKLLAWFKNNYRIYPWREEHSPYRIMIAEFMLQRTRADQVKQVYLKFIEAYPDIQSLSMADESVLRDILKPLGLYWRAAHFKKAANYIVKEYHGIIPSEKNELLKIPGIGDYVAGVILAVAFSENACIIDSNIARVLNRYFGLGLVGEIRRKKEINVLSCDLFNTHNPKYTLFAILDFSALICTPHTPKHEICPLNTSCKYYIQLKDRNL